MAFYALSTTSALMLHNGERMRGELAIAGALADMDIVADPALEARFVRVGKDRNHQLKLSPYLSGYVFAELSDEEYAKAMQLRGVWGALKLRKRSGTSSNAAECFDTQARLFLNRLAKDRDDKERIAESRDKAAMCAFDPGQRVAITSGPLMGSLAHFKAKTQKPGDNFPMIEVEAEFMGQATTVRVDPLDVVAG